MTLKQASAAPCWQVNDAESGASPYADLDTGWPHYATRELAEAARIDMLAAQLDEDPEDQLELVAAESFSAPCLHLFCDGCRLQWDPTENGATHIDPDDWPLVAVTEHDWVQVGDRHYCPDCRDKARRQARTDRLPEPPLGVRLLGERTVEGQDAFPLPPWGGDA